jgi:hypothetical protein
LEQCLASHRELCNAALQNRRDAWRLRRTSVFYGDQSAQLKGIRMARPDVAVWSFAVFSCRRCGHTVNADEHAARNILRAGLARLAATSAA